MMMTEIENDFEINFFSPILNNVVDDAEQKILSPLSIIKDLGDEWIWELDLPFVEKQNVSISLYNGTITVEAKLKETFYDENFGYKNEFNFFKKSITFPSINEKNISAKFANGRLIIRLPKRSVGKKIKIE